MATARDLLATGELVSAGAVPAAGQSRYNLVTLGFYGQQTLAWRDRLYLNGALRRDASSTFGENERWQWYPKLSASYVLGDEPWFHESAIGRPFSSLRLRAALGYAGNQPSIANAYASFDSYVKVVNNDHGLTAAPDDFLLTLEGNATTSGTAVAVNPGTYTAGETLLSGYTFDGFSGDCNGSGDTTVALGQSKTCTLTSGVSLLLPSPL